MVARRAHNPKVVGSNPAPATKFQPLGIPSGFVLSFAVLLIHIRYNKHTFTALLWSGLCYLVMKLSFMAQPVMAKCFAQAIGQNDCALSKGVFDGRAFIKFRCEIAWQYAG